MPALLSLIFFLVLIGGWVANIVKIIGCDLTTIEAIEVLRFIGIFVAPLGVVLGFC